MLMLQKDMLNFSLSFFLCIIFSIKYNSQDEIPKQKEGNFIITGWYHF